MRENRIYLNLLNMLISSYIHFLANYIILFFMAEYSSIYMNHIFVTHFSIDGHLVWFNNLGIVQ